VPPLGIPILEAPRAIIFDIGRVIVQVDFANPSVPFGHGVGHSDSQIMKILQTDPRWIDWQEGRLTARDWHRHFCHRFEIHIGFEDFCVKWNSVLNPQPALPDSLFERLSSRCKLALLSNTDPIHVAHIEAMYSFVRLFPVRIYSCRVGVSKPEPMIYHHALRELDALPEETMFIDDIRENGIAAEALGIAPFLFTTPDDLLSELTRLGL
jgi:putative hydrolase of the HAD superfamily